MEEDRETESDMSKYSKQIRHVVESATGPGWTAGVFVQKGKDMEKRCPRIWGTLHPFFESGDILGRSVANRGFLNALLQDDPYDAYHFFLPDSSACTSVTQTLREAFPDLWARGAFAVMPVAMLPRNIASRPYWCFHLSDCVRQFAPLCRLRNFMARDLFPVTGTTHTLSYARYAADFLGHLWAGTTPRDAVIATSEAGSTVMRAYYQFLRDSFALGPAFRAPQIRRIPLGTDVPDPEHLTALRSAMRVELGLDEAQTVILVFGRFSHFSKMDLLPLLRAVKLAALESFSGTGCASAASVAAGLETAGRMEASGWFDRAVDLAKVRLVLAGWTEAGDDVPEALAGFARNLGISCTIVKRPDDAMRAKLYAGADIFVSPSDNVQETFGLALLEAGAAMLPVVAADWSGYRDIVRHGETGFLIPTIGPADTTRTDVLAHIFYDNQTHLALAQETVVQIPALSLALRVLIHDSGLRLAMGRAAFERVRQFFSWPDVIAHHVALWDELRAIPVDREVFGSVAHPLEFSYARIFSGYPAQVLQGNLFVQISALGQALYRGREGPVLYAGIEEWLPQEYIRRILVRSMRPVPVERLRAIFGAEPLEDADRVILWLLKQGYLECVAAPDSEKTEPSGAL